MKELRLTLCIATTILTGHTTAFSQTLVNTHSAKTKKMETTLSRTDKDVLFELNKQFIRNFITMDTAAHNAIIHPDFTCINGDGSISSRKEYMESWAKGYINSGYTSFSITDENIRVFGNMALVRSRTVYSKHANEETIQGSTVYTDTYIKENGRWRCVQAQITPVKR